MRMPTSGNHVQDAFHCRTCRHSFSTEETLTIHISGVDCTQEADNASFEPSSGRSTSPIVRQPGVVPVRSASTADLDLELDFAPEADTEFAPTPDTMPGLLILSQRGSGLDHDVHRSRARVMPRRNLSGDHLTAGSGAASIKAGLQTPIVQEDHLLANRLSDIAKKGARLQELKMQRKARVAANMNIRSDELVSDLLVNEPHRDRFVLKVENGLPSNKSKSQGFSTVEKQAVCSSSSCSSPPSRQPHAGLLALVSIMLPVLLKAFNSFRTHQQAGQASQGSPPAGTPSSQRSRGTAGNKRKLSRQQKGDDGQDDNSNSDDEGSSRGKPRSRTSPTATEQHWACPFCKWKPLSYQACYAYVLKDISRVKQHLRRRHRIPIHCAICFESFSSEDKRDVHLRARCCQAPADGQAKTFEGVTREQQEMLERRVDKSKTKSDQWYSIYGILFPGEPFPKSPFVDSEVSTHLSAFQQFLADEGMQMVRDMAAQRMPIHLQPLQADVIAFSETLFQHAVPALVQQFETSKGKAKAGAEPDSSPPMPDTPAMSFRESGATSGTESTFASPALPFEHDFRSMDGPTGKPSLATEWRDPPVVPGGYPGEEDSFIYDWTRAYDQLPDDLIPFDEASLTNL